MWCIATFMFCLSAGGCLVADPPQQEERTQTAPLLDALRASPPVTAILDVSPNDQRTISVPFRSEDDGELLLAMLHLNYAIDQNSFVDGVELTPSTFDELRTIQMVWTVPSNLEGCNQLSLVVTHASNVDRFTFRLLSYDDTALLTWWVNVADSDDTLSDCPSPTDLDAGVGP